MFFIFKYFCKKYFNLCCLIACSLSLLGMKYFLLCVSILVSRVFKQQVFYYLLSQLSFPYTFNLLYNL